MKNLIYLKGNGVNVVYNPNNLTSVEIELGRIEYLTYDNEADLNEAISRDLNNEIGFLSFVNSNREEFNDKFIQINKELTKITKEL